LVLPVLVEVDEAEPLLVWVTLTVLELLEDAAPLVTDAVEEPVFEPVLVFEAVPPVFPAVLPLESPEPPT